MPAWKKLPKSVQLDILSDLIKYKTEDDSVSDLEVENLKAIETETKETLGEE